MRVDAEHAALGACLSELAVLHLDRPELGLYLSENRVTDLSLPSSSSLSLSRIGPGWAETEALMTPPPGGHCQRRERAKAAPRPGEGITTRNYDTRLVIPQGWDFLPWSASTQRGYPERPRPMPPASGPRPGGLYFADSCNLVSAPLARGPIATLCNLP